MTSAPRATTRRPDRTRGVRQRRPPRQHLGRSACAPVVAALGHPTDPAARTASRRATPHPWPWRVGAHPRGRGRHRLGARTARVGRPARHGGAGAPRAGVGRAPADHGESHHRRIRAAPLVARAAQHRRSLGRAGGGQLGGGRTCGRRRNGRARLRRDTSAVSRALDGSGGRRSPRGGRHGRVTRGLRGRATPAPTSSPPRPCWHAR